MTKNNFGYQIFIMPIKHSRIFIIFVLYLNVVYGSVSHGWETLNRHLISLENIIAYDSYRGLFRMVEKHSTDASYRLQI